MERIAALAPGERITVYAPMVRGRKGEFREELESLDQQGFRTRIDGEMTELIEGMRLEKRTKNRTRSRPSSTASSSKLTPTGNMTRED